jgi:hypothetical protein
MRAAILRRAALAGLGALLFLRSAPADPSEDLTGTPGAISAGASDNGPADRDYLNNLEIVDPTLKPKLDLVRIGAQRGGNNLLGVFLGLRNKTGNRLALEVETIYKDKAGNVLNTGSWMRLTIEPHAQQDYRSMTIDESAVDFLVRVRRAPAHAAVAVH